MSQAAGQVHHDDGTLGGTGAGLPFSAEQLGQRQSAQGEAANLQKRTTGNAVAVTMTRSSQGEHDSDSEFRGGWRTVPPACGVVGQSSVAAAEALANRRTNRRTAFRCPCF